MRNNTCRPTKNGTRVAVFEADGRKLRDRGYYYEMVPLDQVPRSSIPAIQASPPQMDMSVTSLLADTDKMTPVIILDTLVNGEKVTLYGCDCNWREAKIQ